MARAAALAAHLAAPPAPGFADPVFDAQAAFRAILSALARPGLPAPIPARPAPPAPLTPELAAVALALADPDAPLWLDDGLARAPAVASYLSFHTGAPIVADPGAAAFALVRDPRAMPDPGAFHPGTDLYPDRSTTLVLALEALEGGPPIALAGPGIPGSVEVRARGLPSDFSARLAANRARFPLGVDWLLVARGAVLGIPRSSRLAAETP